MTGAGLLVGALVGAEAYPEFKHLLHSHELDRSGLILPRPIVFSAHSEIDKKVFYLNTYINNNNSPIKRASCAYVLRADGLD